MTISRHKKSRFWALHDTDGALVCICVYKKGAQEVQKRLQREDTACSCRQPTDREKNTDMREYETNFEQRETSVELPPWTPFVRTGQVIADGLPNTPDGEIWENSRYVVIVRDCGGGGEGKLVWLSIKNADNSARHDWRELQRIKNELVGTDVEAVELYPAESRLVDNANQWHLWCVVGFRFPFGFEERLVSEDTPGVTQRPFEPDMRPPDLATVQIEGLAQIVHEEPQREFAAGAVPLPAMVRLPRDREQRFLLGELVITHDAALALHNAGQTAEPYLLRHLQGDWGIMDDTDRVANDLALQNGERLLSCYALPTGEPIWIITEANRASTSILTPDEY